MLLDQECTMFVHDSFNRVGAKKMIAGQTFPDFSEPILQQSSLWYLR